MNEHDDGIVIFGASGHARLIIDAIESSGQYKICGLFDSYKPKGFSLLTYQVLGTEEDVAGFMRETGVRKMIVGIGDNWCRHSVSQTLKTVAPDLCFATAIHLTAYVSPHAMIGPGTVVLAGAVVGMGCRIHEGCILGARASLDHDSTMLPFSSLGPGVTTGGSVQVGMGSAVCLGANVIQNVRIGNCSVVGAGSTTVRDIPDNVVAYGTPARVMRNRIFSDRYL